MRKPKPNRAREKRIIDEIVVDACTSDERAIGWHCYLDDKLRFPFKAKCVSVMRSDICERRGAVPRRSSLC